MFGELNCHSFLNFEVWDINKTNQKKQNKNNLKSFKLQKKLCQKLVKQTHDWDVWKKHVNSGSNKQCGDIVSITRMVLKNFQSKSLIQIW